jgi:hypothetical protein
MSPTPVPPAALDAPAPTSRSTFRSLIKGLDATNREADTLRHNLLAVADGDELARRLRTLDSDDPDGAGGIESRLAIWFEGVESADGRLVATSDPVLRGVSPALAERLAAIEIPRAAEYPGF